MKKLFVFPTIAALFAFTACSGGGSGTPRQDTGTITIAADQLNQTVAATATSTDIIFSTEDAWSADFENEAEWLSFDPENGDAGDNTINVNMQANTSDSARKAVIVITSGTSKAKVTINQAAGGNTGGGDGDEFIITATNVTALGVSDSDVVKVAAVWLPFDAETDDEAVTVATAAYSNHGFTIKLPALANNMLERLPEEEGGITVSDPTAKVGSIVIVGLNADDEFLYFFDYASDDFSVVTQYMYADRDVNVIGALFEEGSYENEIYDMRLKKGWNAMYNYYNENNDDIYTTTLPAGYTMGWYCYQS